MSASFSGSTPLAICQAYAGGRIDRAQLIDELGRFPYAPKTVNTDPLNDIVTDPEDSWAGVEAALLGGVIDESIYAEVFAQRHPGHGQG